MERAEKIIWQIYKEMYEASTPSVDFDELVKSAETNELGQKEIPYNDYEISEKDFIEIIERNIKGKRLTKMSQQMIKNTVTLGCSPKIKKSYF